MAVDHALEHVFEVGIGLDVVEPCRGDEGADDGPTLCATIGAGEQMVLAPEHHRPDGALDGVVVELDAAPRFRGGRLCRGSGRVPASRASA